MYYITARQPERWEQLSIEDILFGTQIPKMISDPGTGTITYEREFVSDKFRERTDVDRLIDMLHGFNEMTKELRQVDRKTLYREFTIPKKSGGRRTIDAPNDILKLFLTRLKDMFEKDFGVLYHTNAFAYIKGRSIMDAMEKHKKNESKWFAKYDFTNFFGSITLEFAMDMMSRVYPFCLIMERDDGENELRTAIELGFLNGGLPQGTPLSPTLTNIIMIPIDFCISKTLRSETEKDYCITRYADDFQISSKYMFDYKHVEDVICNVAAQFNAPIKLNHTKTRYGSSSGRNWNLGLMLNRENNITIGWEKKKKLQAELASFIMDTKNGHPWDASKIYVLNGHLSFLRQVEGDVADRIAYHVGRKFGVDPFLMIKAELNK